MEAFTHVTTLTIDDDDAATLQEMFARNLTHPGIVVANGLSLLHVAGMRGALACCQTLIAKGADPGAQDEDGDTPAACAIMKKHVLVALTLLASAPRASFTNKAGVHCLAMAAALGLVDVVEWFLGQRLLVNAKSGPAGFTALMEAVRAGHVHCARLLIAAGCDVAARTTKPPHLTTLHLAGLFNNVESVHMLCTAGADPLAQDDDGDTPLHCALGKKFGSMARGLLYASPATAARQLRVANKAGATPAQMAAALDAEFAEELTAIATTPKGNATAAQAELETYLKSAPTLDVPKMRALMASGASARTILFHAVSGLNTQLAQFALNHAADLAWVDNDGDSILHLVSYNDEALVPIISGLVGAGADVNMQNKKGFTPLHISALRDKPLFVRVLLQQAPLVKDALDTDGDTPLHGACGKARPEVVRDLVQQGFDPRVRNSSGETPLHIAIRAQDVASAVYLALQCPEGLNIPNKAGVKPLDLPSPAAAAVNKALREMTAGPETETTYKWRSGDMGKFDTTAWRLRSYNGLAPACTVEHPKHGRGVVVGIHTGRICVHWETDPGATRFNTYIGCPDYQAREFKLIATVTEPGKAGGAGGGDGTGGSVAIPTADLAVDFDKPLGTGGFGAVYGGTYAGTPVAVKVARGIAVSEADRAALRTEVGMLARIRHPNVLLLMGHSVAPDGSFSLVTELADGGDLNAYLERRRATLTAEDRLDLAIQIVQGVAHLHHHNIVHRDLKSANVLVTRHGVAKIGDFGLAKLRESTSAADSGTGTLAYMAPELFSAETTPSSKSDMYAVAMILYELYTGRSAHTALMEAIPGVDTPAAFGAGVRGGARPSLEGVAPAVAKLVAEVWAGDAAARPTAAQLLERLKGMSVRTM